MDARGQTGSHSERRAAGVARQIEDDIVRAGWPIGQVIASAPALRERYGVSPAVLREAIRVVEHHNVAVMRAGNRGGLVVRAPDREPATIALELYLRRSGIRRADVRRAQRAVAPSTEIVAGNAPLTVFADVLERLDRWLIAGEPVDGGPMFAATTETKRAGSVADRILADLTAAGAVPGQVVASEADLLDRYGASRAVVREAVRMLELHSIAYMRKGPGGGLAVAGPDPRASVQAMALYLEYHGVDQPELRTARDVIELAGIELATARAGRPAVVERLEAMTTRLVAAAEFRAVTETATAIHGVVAELSGNPALALFQKVITVLLERHTALAPSESPVDASVSVRQDHRDMLAVVGAGDVAAARTWLADHLDVVDNWWA
jgi:DNA-binding FadR family transcriptional regulator